MRYILALSILILSSCNLIQHKGIAFETVSRDTSNNFYSLNVTYPLFHSPSQLITLNDSINKVLFKHTTYYRGKEYEDLKALLMDINPNNTPTRRYQTTIDYHPFLVNSNFISIRFKIYEYTLGAHGNTFYVSLNYNPKTNTFFQVNELLNLSSGNNKQKLCSLLKEHLVDPNECFNINLKSIEAINHINFNSNRTIFTFAPYEIGPYACGTAQIEIPTHKLIASGIIKSEISNLITRN